jgi:hypothetical protein
MFVRLLPNQIPSFWEAIKYAAVKADAIRDKDIPRYLNQLLYALLSDKAQCFIRLSDDRKLQVVVITRLIADQVTGDKSLFINCIYGFQSSDIDTWRDNFSTVVSYAKQRECKMIIAWSANERVWEICDNLGFEERLRSFIVDL